MLFRTSHSALVKTGSILPLSILEKYSQSSIPYFIRFMSPINQSLSIEDKVTKFGYNPKYGYGTPFGIYAYPVNWVYEESSLRPNTFFRDLLPFAADRPVAQIFSHERGKLIYVSQYTRSARNRDLRELRLLPIVDQLADKMEKEKNQNAMASEILSYFNIPHSVPTALQYFEDSGDWVDSLIKLAETTAFKKPSLDFSEVWNATRVLSGFIKKYLRRMPTDSSPIIWTKLMMDIGWSGVHDDAGEGIIHDNEPIQAVFFDIRDLKLAEEVYLKENLFQKEEINKISFPGANFIFSDQQDPEVIKQMGRRDPWVFRSKDGSGRSTIRNGLFEYDKSGTLVALGDTELQNVNWLEGVFSGRAIYGNLVGGELSSDSILEATNLPGGSIMYRASIFKTKITSPFDPRGRAGAVTFWANREGFEFQKGRTKLTPSEVRFIYKIPTDTVLGGFTDEGFITLSISGRNYELVKWPEADDLIKYIVALNFENAENLEDYINFFWSAIKRTRFYSMYDSMGFDSTSPEELSMIDLGMVDFVELTGDDLRQRQLYGNRLADKSRLMAAKNVWRYLFNYF